MKMTATKTSMALMIAFTTLTSGCAVMRDQQTVGSYVDDSAISNRVRLHFVESPIVSMHAIDVETLNKHIDLMTNAYAQIVQTAAEAAMKDAVNQSQVDKLTEAGWTYSYAFYMRITTAASSANAALNNFPISSATLKEEDFKIIKILNYD